MEINPQDGVEDLLAVQMVATHHAALECPQRTAFPDQKFEGREMALKHAQRMMTTLPAPDGGARQTSRQGRREGHG